MPGQRNERGGGADACEEGRAGRRSCERLVFRDAGWLRNLVGGVDESLDLAFGSGALVFGAVQADAEVSANDGGVGG